MNRKALFLILLLAPVFIAAGPGRKAPKYEYDLFKNTVQNAEGLRVSKYEVSNREYKEFLFALIEENKAHLVSKYAPDMEVWLRDVAFNDPYREYYFSHHAFEEYPVVGVSHEAAVAFCEWKTRRYGKMPAAKKDKAKADYQFRLPSEEEWMAFAETGAPSRYFWPGGVAYPRNHKGKFEFNHKLGKGDYAGYIGEKGHDYEGYMITAPVYTFKTEKLDVCNMAGNVAEMVEEEGIAKGGSWAHVADSCRINAQLRYEDANAWLGFRYVVAKVTD